MLLRHSYWGYTALKRDKWPLFWAPQYKESPHRRFGGGVEICCRFIIFDLWQKKSFPFFRFVSNILIREMAPMAKTFPIYFLTEKWPHIFSIFCRKIFSISPPQKVMRCTKKIYKIRVTRFLCINLQINKVCNRKLKSWEIAWQNEVSADNRNNLLRT